MNSVAPKSSTSSRYSSIGRRLLAPVGLDRLARTRPLLLHAGAEAVEVDAAAALLGDLAGEVDREAERVVQEERLLAGDVAVLEQAVEEIETALQRLAEALLLARDDVHDDVVVLDQIGVRRAHGVDGRVDDAPA